jgi:hypothetical protein
MKTILEILRGLVGLFVDDELLAVGVLGVVALTVLSITVVGTAPLAAGAVLLCGNMVVLVVGAVGKARGGSTLRMARSTTWGMTRLPRPSFGAAKRASPGADGLWSPMFSLYSETRRQRRRDRPAGGGDADSA